jgi:RNA polymerase sigma factor (TIGR02999 family)
MMPIAPATVAHPAAAGMVLQELTPPLYQDLRRIARRHLSAERSNHTLQATALVHEAYLKLARHASPNFMGEVHLLAVASRVMRQVLVDYARSRATEKRLGELNQLDFDTAIEIKSDKGHELVNVLALEEALTALAAENPQLSELVEMRFFGCMTAEESAEALSVSVHVVRHQLRFAQAWLKKRMSRGN